MAKSWVKEKVQDTVLINLSTKIFIFVSYIQNSELYGTINYVVSCMLPCMFCGVYVFYYQDLLYVILSK